MDDTKKMFRAIINGQSAMKSELLVKIEGIDKKVDGLEKKIDGVESRLSKSIDRLDKKLTKRINKIGLQVASLEDDAPTIEEFDKLEKRVTKLEPSSASV
jgi:hypothetical protein